MVEMITGLTVAARVVTFVADYQSYNQSKRKEDDLAVRRFILNRSNSARGQTNNILKWAYKNGNSDLENSAKGILQELDLLKNEVNLAETGMRWPFFTPKCSVDANTLEKIIDFDAGILEEMEQVVKALREMELAIAEEEYDIMKGMIMIDTAIGRTRDNFRGRIELIKGQK